MGFNSGFKGLRLADRFEYRRFRCEQYRDLKRSTAAHITSEETIARDWTEIYGERQREERAVELMSDLGAGDRVAIYQIRLNLLRDQSYWFGRDLWPFVSCHMPGVRKVSPYHGTLLHARTTWDTSVTFSRIWNMDFLTFICPCIFSISLKYNQQDATFSRSIYFYKLLYIFQAVPPPIIRSTKLYTQHTTTFHLIHDSSRQQYWFYNTWRCMYSFVLLMMGGGTAWNM